MSRLSIGSTCSTVANPAATRPPTRRVGESCGDEVWIFGLEALELPHQRIEFSVGDLRIVQDVVALFVMPDEYAELVDSFCGRHARLSIARKDIVGQKHQRVARRARRECAERALGALDEFKGGAAVRSRSSASARGAPGARASRRVSRSARRTIWRTSASARPSPLDSR